MLTAEERLRYSRQIRLSPNGETRQECLGRARAVVLGCGALGSAAAERLVRAGLGHLTLVDRDLVELSNLPRQTLYTEADAQDGWPKAEAAARHLRAINGACDITPRVLHISPENIESLIAGADCVLDGGDNFELRYLLNDAAVKHGIPWVYAGVLGTEALTLAIVPGKTPCLRCLFEQAPSPGSAPQLRNLRRFRYERRADRQSASDRGPENPLGRARNPARQAALRRSAARALHGA